MTEFHIKKLRCEWQVVVYQIDPHGCKYPDSALVLSRWPTADEAYRDLPNHGYEDELVKGRWIPNNAISIHEWLEVCYQEVEVK